MVAARRVWIGVAVGVLAASTGVQAQGLREVRERGSFGVSAVLARPVGEFQQFVDWGGGITLNGVKMIHRDAGLGIRLEGTFLVYGQDDVAVPFSNTVPFVLLDVTTTNTIASVGIGPQLQFGDGWIKPYVYGTVGLSYFATVTSLRGIDDPDPFLRQTDFDDVSFAAAGGAGLRLQLSRGRRPVALDLGVTSTWNGEVEYLRAGSLRSRVDGSTFFVPIRSEANLVTARLGVTVSFY